MKYQISPMKLKRVNSVLEMEDCSLSEAQLSNTY